MNMTGTSVDSGFNLQVEVGRAYNPIQPQDQINDQIQLISTPEPGTVTFTLLGLAAIAARRRRRG